MSDRTEFSHEPADEIRDHLPADLDASDHRVDYRFPDNSRRRVPGVIYVVGGITVLVLSLTAGDDAVMVNRGLLAGGLLLIGFGLVGITSGWRMRVDEQGALSAAAEAVGFAVGHASAQQVWTGLRSRPAWRVLCYSDEDPPRQRGLVLVDAVSGRVIEHLAQEADEVWS